LTLDDLKGQYSVVQQEL